jgi:hypothetical protein
MRTCHDCMHVHQGIEKLHDGRAALKEKIREQREKATASIGLAIINFKVPLDQQTFDQHVQNIARRGIQEPCGERWHKCSVKCQGVCAHVRCVKLVSTCTCTCGQRAERNKTAVMDGCRRGSLPQFKIKTSSDML